MDNEALVLDFLEWLAAKPRAYGDVMDAWRTSCPRLTIWEDAIDAGLVQRQQHTVHITERGRLFRQQHSGAAHPRS